MDEIGEQPQRLTHFRILYITMQLVGLTIIILTVSWINSYLGGVAWTSDPMHQFNWHPLLMTIGMVYLYGNSILIYRGLRYGRKRNLKITHASIFVTIFVFAVIALVAVFDSHNLAEPPIANLYSFHSWVGLTAVIFFCLQWVGGFASFFFPQLKAPLKEAYMPIHIFFGLLGFVLAVVAALLGFAEKVIFRMDKVAVLSHEGLIVNCIASLIVIFAALVVFIATEKGYKRQALPEDAMLLTGSTD